MSTRNPTEATPNESQQTIQSKSIEDIPVSTDHAKLRWLQRGDFQNTALAEAWLEGFYVGDVTRGGSTKLHPPSRTILVSTDGHIITVLNAKYTSFTDDHLIVCDECDLRYQPSEEDKQCRWCSCDPSGVKL